VEAGAKVKGEGCWEPEGFFCWEEEGLVRLEAMVMGVDGVGGGMMWEEETEGVRKGRLLIEIAYRSHDIVRIVVS